jgi:PKD domain/Carbohydrate binding domain
MTKRNRATVRLICLAALLALAGCAAPEPQNQGAPTPASASVVDRAPRASDAALLTNGAFESGDLSGWNVDGGVAASSATAHAGSWSARVSYGGSGAAGMEADLDTSVGTAYKVTAWVKIVSETGDDWGGFRIAATSWDWKELARAEPLIAKTRGGDWFKVAFSFSAATPRTRLRVGYFGGPGRSTVVDVDDIAVFAKGPNKPPEITAALTPASSDGLPTTQQFAITGDDPDGAIVRVAWDFGDGTRALAPSGSRQIALPGTYVATVRVADDEGAVAVKTIPWTAVDKRFPTLAIEAPAEPETTVHSATLALHGSASDGASVRISTDRGYIGAASGVRVWSAQATLQPGWNRILVQATAADGRIVTSERRVRYVPQGPLGISNLAESAPSVDRWEVLEVTFALDNSAATHPQFPYDPSPPPGLESLDGVSVDGLFTPDDWRTIYRRPAFLNQRYERALKNDEEWMYPQGAPIWTVRFAPPATGAWKYRIAVREARGSAQSAERTFSVTAPADPSNHGPLRVAANDPRYFEYADGTPFLGAGHGVGFSPERFSYDAIGQFDAIGAGNQNFLRWWLGGNIWGSAWQIWRSLTLNNDGYLPATSLTLDRAYANGLASLKLDAANPLMFQGWNTGHASLIPGRTYRLRARWRTEGVTGLAAAGQPYGVTLKFVDWPEPGKTGSLPPLVPHVHGDTPWHVVEGEFVAAGDMLPNLALILENATGGAAYVDEIDLYELLPGGALGPQLLRNAQLNAHLTFDLRRGAAIDLILAEAARRGLAFKLVVSEKNEYLLNHLGPDGLPDPNGGDFNRGAGTPTARLHAYYWRHLFARFGAYRSVHSWELVNEAAPDPGDHFRLAAALAAAAAADGDPHMASTSTWATLAEQAWKDPDSAPIAYADFHAYVRGTGWITPQEELANDSARFFAEYDRAARAAGFGKPVVWGEQGIDDAGNTNQPDPLLANDRQGVWLHKLVWARCGPGGVYPLYWYTDSIYANALHPVFGAWNRFMAGIPLTNGRYEDIAAATSTPDLRVFGQKDMQTGSAYLWIDNRQDTWRAAVDGRAIPAAGGALSIALGQSAASYTVTWYDTATGKPTTTETHVADAAGVLVLNVADLKSDVAARVLRERP